MHRLFTARLFNAFLSVYAIVYIINNYNIFISFHDCILHDTSRVNFKILLMSLFY